MGCTDSVGSSEGALVGCTDTVGSTEGVFDGIRDDVGAMEGKSDGALLGDIDGGSVGVQDRTW